MDNADSLIVADTKGFINSRVVPQLRSMSSIVFTQAPIVWNKIYTTISQELYKLLGDNKPKSA